MNASTPIPLPAMPAKASLPLETTTISPDPLARSHSSPDRLIAVLPATRSGMDRSWTGQLVNEDIGVGRSPMIRAGLSPSP